MKISLQLKRALTPMVVLLVWELLGLFGILNPVFFPTLAQVVSAAISLLKNGQLLSDIYASLRRILAGYLIAASTGILTGILMGYFQKIHNQIDPLVELLRAIPTIALIPLTIIWFGIGDIQKIFLIFYATYFPIVISTVVGVQKTEPVLLDAAKNLGARSLTILRRVILPSSLPSIFGGLRISMAIGFIVIVAAELVGSNSGLGYLILTAQEFYQTPTIFVGILTIAGLAFLLDQVIRLLQRTIMPWERP